MDTVELTVKLIPKDPWSDILIAELSDRGFDSFVNTDDGLIAYCEDSVDVDKIISETLLNGKMTVDVDIYKSIIPYQNWNAKWEADFQPVYIEEYATIIAPFHKEIETKGNVVIIQPQMSFGTGHHQTTWMMTKALFELDNMPEHVLDMGTGTGVLAVVAEKLGAREILAIDIEDWSVINAQEKTDRNNCKTITCVCGDIDKVIGNSFGLIIANINKNILKAHMKTYSNALLNEGTLLLSGFFSSDIDEIVEFTKELNLEKTKVLAKDEWACIQFTKSKTDL
jgi:ribosomal protein L11 methyltransferase